MIIFGIIANSLIDNSVIHVCNLSNIVTSNSVFHGTNPNINIINNIVNLAVKYELDGINLDFENKAYAMIGNHDDWEGGNDFIHLTPELFDWLNERKYDINIENGDINAYYK